MGAYVPPDLDTNWIPLGHGLSLGISDADLENGSFGRRYDVCVDGSRRATGCHPHDRFTGGDIVS